jgi:hypothetical protein
MLVVQTTHPFTGQPMQKRVWTKLFTGTLVQDGQQVTVSIEPTQFFNDPKFNGNILIQGNTFTNDVSESDAVAVDVRNAVSVTFENNTFNGYPEPVVVDPKNTRDIKLQQLE